MAKTNDTARPYIAAFYKNNRLLWCAVMLFTVIEVPMQLLMSWLLGAILDVITTGDMSALVGMLPFIGAGVAVCVINELALAKARSVFVKRALSQYKSLAYEKLSEKRISAFYKENTGRYISVFTNDITSIEEKYLINGFQIVLQVLLFVGALVMMFVYSPILAAAAIVLSLLPVAVSAAFGKLLTKKEKDVSDKNERFVSRIKDLLNGFSVIKSFKAEKETRTLFDGENGVIESAKASRRWCMGAVGAAGMTCGLILQLGVFVFGAYLAITGSITAGAVIVFVQLGNYIINPISTVPQYIAGRKAAKGLIEKLAEITEENAERTGDRFEPVLKNSIKINNLSFSYEKDKPVLSDITLSMKAGGKYALVGESGSGKSTLLNLLMGAYDGYGGSLTVDGRELKNADPDSLYDLMSLIGQNVFLFDDTIKSNITMFRDFPEKEVRRAEERSGLYELIERKGKDYSVGENGVNLSGGERQRVSIARSLLRGTPVLLLDEATAALDNRTAFSVTEAILSLDGLTRVVVTHRLEKALLTQYDEIFVLRGGRLWEHGTFEQLMEKNGYFYSLFTISNG